MSTVRNAWRYSGTKRELVALGMVAWLAACSDTPSSPQGPQPPPKSFTVVASEPMRLRGAAVAQGSAAGAALQQGDSITWVSLPVGTVPAGRSATIRNLASGFGTTVDVVDGGFDPVPLLARVGDSVAVVVTDSSGATTRVVSAVPARKAPVVVRTVPPRRGTDVPLNSLIQVVFSEPMDSRTLTTTNLYLLRGSTPVAGRVVVSTDALRADFVSDAPLAPETAYALEVAASVADLSGDTLGERVTAEFTTGRRAGSVASVTINPDTAFLAADTFTAARSAGRPGSVTLTVKARDADGNPLSGFRGSWSSSDPRVAQVDTVGVVQGLGAGAATITVTIDGRQGSALIRVLGAWPVIAINPDSDLTLAVGDRVTFTTTVTNPVPELELTWRATAEFLSLSRGTGNTATITVTNIGSGTVSVALWEPTWGSLGGRSVWVRSPRPGSRVASVTIEPSSVRMAYRTGWVPLRATARDASGNVLPDALVTWTSSIAGAFGGPPYYTRDRNPFDRFVAVSVNGIGSATFTATAGGHSATAMVEAALLRFDSIASGVSCGLTAAGVAYCYGLMMFNGVGTEPASGLVAVAGAPAMVSVTGAPGHGCGRTAAGAAHCWGLNDFGQLGTDQAIGVCYEGVNRPPACSPTAAPVAGGHQFLQISTAPQHTCAVTKGGAAWCWGSNTFGELGEGTTTHRLTPVPVAGGLAFRQINAFVADAGHRTCGLTTSGAAYCWGIGIGNQPVAVAGGLAFTQISRSCGLTAGGGAFCWGATTAPSPYPNSTGIAFAQIHASEDHFCGRTADGTLYCDGADWVGPGEDDWVAIPLRAVGGGIRFRSIGSDGAGYTCGMATDEIAYCYPPWHYPGSPRVIEFPGQR